MSRPYLTAGIFGTSLDALIIIDLVADLPFDPHGIEFVGFFPKAASGDIHAGCIGGRLACNDIDDPAFRARTIHHGSRTAKDFYAFHIIHVVQKRCERIPAGACAFEVIESYAVYQDDDIVATIDANTAQVRIETVGAIVQELNPRNGTQRIFYAFHMQSFDLVAIRC